MIRRQCPFAILGAIATMGAAEAVVNKKANTAAVYPHLDVSDTRPPLFWCSDSLNLSYYNIPADIYDILYVLPVSIDRV